MIQQKLQEFEEEVKATADVITQVRKKQSLMSYSKQVYLLKVSTCKPLQAPACYTCYRL